MYTVVHPHSGMNSAPRRTEPPGHGKAERKLQCLFLSEKRQLRKAVHCTIPALLHPKKANLGGGERWVVRRDKQAEYKGLGGR